MIQARATNVLGVISGRPVVDVFDIESDWGAELNTGRGELRW